MINMARVITFGEIMMRLNPEGYQRFVQADKFEASYAGGECNVAVSLANYGMDAAFVSKVPAHEIGQCAVNALRQYGVDTKYMVRGGDRLGVYYCEKGASQRASKVIYDRKNSAIALAQPEDFDWDTIFDGADWFHWTGITPALGGKLPEICLAACKVAKAKGVTISCDLNFRKKLWSSTQANEVMSVLMPYVDVCISKGRKVFSCPCYYSDSGIYLLEIKLAVCNFGNKIVFQSGSLGWHNVIPLAYGSEMEQIFRILPRSRSDPACFSPDLFHLLQIIHILLIHSDSPPYILLGFLPQHPPK